MRVSLLTHDEDEHGCLGLAISRTLKHIVWSQRIVGGLHQRDEPLWEGRKTELTPLRTPQRQRTNFANHLTAKNRSTYPVRCARERVLCALFPRSAHTPTRARVPKMWGKGFGERRKGRLGTLTGAAEAAARKSMSVTANTA